MLITFITKRHPEVVMFGAIAQQLLTAMGESAEPPGILRGEGIKTAAARLRAYLQRLPEEHVQSINSLDDEPDLSKEALDERLNYVGLKERALPLLDLMDAAYIDDIDVIWR